MTNSACLPACMPVGPVRCLSGTGRQRTGCTVLACTRTCVRSTLVRTVVQICRYSFLGGNYTLRLSHLKRPACCARTPSRRCQERDNASSVSVERLSDFVLQHEIWLFLASSGRAQQARRAARSFSASQGVAVVATKMTVIFFTRGRWPTSIRLEAYASILRPCAIA